MSCKEFIFYGVDDRMYNHGLTCRVTVRLPVGKVITSIKNLTQVPSSTTMNKCYDSQCDEGTRNRVHETYFVLPRVAVVLRTPSTRGY